MLILNIIGLGSVGLALLGTILLIASGSVQSRNSMLTEIISEWLRRAGWTFIILALVGISSIIAWAVKYTFLG